MVRRWIVIKECYAGEWNGQAAFQKVIDHVIDKDNILN